MRKRRKTALDTALEFSLMETELDEKTFQAAEKELAELREKAWKYDELSR